MQVPAKNKMKYVWAVVAGVVLLVFPLVFSNVYNFAVYIADLALLYIVAVSGLDILFGYSGQISMGHAAFFAIGAYGSAMLNLYFRVPPLIGMVIAAFGAALIGALLAIPASKLVFHFLSLATIAFAEIVYQLISQSPNAVTGNFQGLYPIPFQLFGFTFNTNTRVYFLFMAITVILLILKNNLVHSKYGRAFIAIRDNNHAANGMGVNVKRYKVLAFSVSAFYTAVAGSMYAHFITFISPETFVRKQSIMFLTMLLFGGTASLAGPIVGAITVLLLNEGIRFANEYQMFIYGVLMLLVILILPGGLYGTLKERILLYRGRRRNAEN